jgi:regulator of replication initiation timing
VDSGIDLAIDQLVVKKFESTVAQNKQLQSEIVALKADKSRMLVQTQKLQEELQDSEKRNAGKLVALTRELEALRKKQALTDTVLHVAISEKNELFQKTETLNDALSNATTKIDSLNTQLAKTAKKEQERNVTLNAELSKTITKLGKARAANTAALAQIRYLEATHRKANRPPVAPTGIHKAAINDCNGQSSKKLTVETESKSNDIASIGTSTEYTGLIPQNAQVPKSRPPGLIRTNVKAIGEGLKEDDIRINSEITNSSPSGTLHPRKIASSLSEGMGSLAGGSSGTRLQTADSSVATNPGGSNLGLLEIRIPIKLSLRCVRNKKYQIKSLSLLRQDLLHYHRYLQRWTQSLQNLSLTRRLSTTATTGATIASNC